MRSKDAVIERLIERVAVLEMAVGEVSRTLPVDGTILTPFDLAILKRVYKIALEYNDDRR